MKKLLYISFLYPPVGGSGVQRSLKFAKYLPAFGWEPIMLVADARFLKQPKDESLKNEIPREQVIYSAFSPDIRWLYKLLWGLKLNRVVNFINRMMIPDADILWLPLAKLAVKRILRQHKIDMVFITAPPYSGLLLGLHIKKHYGIEFCVDFRDMWTLGVGRADNPPPSWIRHWEAKLEERVISHAKKVIVVNDSMKQKMLEHYPHLALSNVQSITNGFDEEDFPVAKHHQPKQYLNIVFTGSFYGRFQPDMVWAALVALFKEAKITPADIRIDIYGKNNSSFVLGAYAVSKDIRSCVRIHPYLSHKDSVNKMSMADALLLLSPSGVGADMDSHSKLFEYMRSGTTILAVIPPQSAGAQILAPCGTAIIADSADQEAVKQAILSIFSAWKDGSPTPQPNTSYIAQFERQALTRKLAQCFEEALV